MLSVSSPSRGGAAWRVAGVLENLATGPICWIVPRVGCSISRTISRDLTCGSFNTEGMSLIGPMGILCSTQRSIHSSVVRSRNKSREYNRKLDELRNQNQSLQELVEAVVRELPDEKKWSFEERLQKIKVT